MKYYRFAPQLICAINDEHMFMTTNDPSMPVYFKSGARKDNVQQCDIIMACPESTYDEFFDHIIAPRMMKLNDALSFLLFMSALEEENKLIKQN